MKTLTEEQMQKLEQDFKDSPEYKNTLEYQLQQIAIARYALFQAIAMSLPKWLIRMFK